MKTRASDDQLLRGRRILLTGGSGFIGTHVIQRLSECGASIYNLDILPPKVENASSRWLQVDVLDYPALRQTIREVLPTDVLHLAARTDSDGRSLSDYRINVDGTLHVAKALGELDTRARVVHVSSQFVVGPGRLPLNDIDYRPHTVYGQSKVESERIIRGLPTDAVWTIVRPTNIWGPWHPRYPREFWRTLNRRLYIHPGRRPVIRSYGYVGNVAHQIAKIVELPVEEVNRKTFYLGDRSGPNIEWVDAFALALTGRRAVVAPRAAVFGLAIVGEAMVRFGLKSPLFLSRYRSMTEDYTTPMEPTFKLLGEPPFSLLEGVAATTTWLRGLPEFQPRRHSAVRRYHERTETKFDLADRR
jgi:GlcNAc-P-P-Und epimerase